MSIGKRLSEQRKLNGYTSQRGFADKLEISYPTLSRWENNQTMITADKLAEMEALGFDIVYIITGKPATVADYEKQKSNKNKYIENIPLAKPATIADFEAQKKIEVAPSTYVDADDYAWIPLYNVEVSAGNGRFTDHENILTYFSLSKYSLRKRGLTHFDQLGYVIVHGDSMHDTLHPNDCILINFEKRNPDGGIFVLRVGDVMHVKRLIAEKNSISVISDNERYDSWSLGEGDDFEIIGKYEWHGRYAQN